MTQPCLPKHRGRWTTLLLAAVSTASAPAADAPQPTTGHRVALLAPSGPILVNVRLETGSKSIRQVREAFCESLFKRLDVDQSGKLETAEQSQLPTFRRTGNGVATAQSFLTEGSLTLDGLTKSVDAQLGPVFSVEMKPPRADQTVRLLEALDENDDGVLSVNEIVNSTQALTRYDLDDDESLSVNELQPFPQSVRQAQRQQAVAERRGSRVILLESASDVDAASAAMKELYVGGKGEASVAVERCGLAGGAAAFDADGDKKLDAAELKAWLLKGATDVELIAAWRELGRGLPPSLKVVAATSDRISPVKGGLRQWNASVDGVPVQASIIDNRSYAGDAVKLLTSKALQSDKDNNDYLDEAEFAGLGSNAPFSAVDANHDNMVKADEIRQYFTIMSQLSQTRVVMTFSDDVTSLFRLMDADATNRLSPREMMTLRERITPYDRNGNGQFDPADFVSKYILLIAFAQPDGLEFTPQAQMMAGSTGGVRRSRLVGPMWYQRMDRNRDGDISWREFLGPRPTFDSIDADHDGLISREEAERAEMASAPTTAER